MQKDVGVYVPPHRRDVCAVTAPTHAPATALAIDDDFSCLVTCVRDPYFYKSANVEAVTSFLQTAHRELASLSLPSGVSDIVCACLCASPRADYGVEQACLTFPASVTHVTQQRCGSTRPIMQWPFSEGSSPWRLSGMLTTGVYFDIEHRLWDRVGLGFGYSCRITCALSPDALISMATPARDERH